MRKIMDVCKRKIRTFMGCITKDNIHKDGSKCKYCGHHHCRACRKCIRCERKS